MMTKFKNFILKAPYLSIKIPAMVSAIALISCVLFLPFLSHADCNVKGDGRLSLYSYHIDEYIDVTYRSGSKYNQEALKKIYNVLRSPDGEVRTMETQVIDLVDNIQDHFGARTVEIISGYRSPNYNTKLKEEGRNVAKESLHMEGKAIDIHIDEITEEKLRDYALKLGCGGVGIYLDNDFVHVDVGPIKTWTSAGNGRKLVGMNNNKSPIKLITDKNDYFKGDKILLSLKNESGRPEKPEKHAGIETFRNGKWIEKGDLELDFLNNIAKVKLNPSLPYGRFRIRLKSSNTLSNEFYLKRL